MSEKRRLLLLIFIMAVIALTSAAVSDRILWTAALSEERARLTETVQSRARLMEAVARFDEEYSNDYPLGATAATISQITEAHENFKGFGETGEFLLARREGDMIVFILRHRHHDLEAPASVPFGSELAEAMRYALSGLSGTIIGLDYRGVTVLAAHEPVAVLDLGIVAKIDLAEIRAPFIRATQVSILFIVVLTLAGALVFQRVFNPIILRLERHAEELEQRVKERTADLEASNKEMESFAYSVSHDLRAPLRGIDGFSRILEDEHGQGIGDQERHYLERIRNGVRTMGQLIDDMLKLSRSTRGEINRERLDLSAIARAVAGDLERTHPGREIVLEIADGMEAFGDPRFMRVVIENLLGNAWKYTERTAEARIEFGVTKGDGETVFFVRDNGAGFDPAYAGKMFAPFQRLHSPAEFEGSGVGLATVQRIIHRHGGRVWARGLENEGATLFFTLGKMG